MIEQYKQLHKHIKERAIYINDMLAEMDVAEHLQEYLPKYCGVCSEAVNMCVSYNVIMLSYTDYDDYTTHWYVDAAYIDTPDEAIKTYHLDVIESEYNKDMAHKLRNLHEDAKMFGYRLVKEEE